MTKAAFAPHRIKKLTPYNDTVIVSDMEFDKRITTGGIILLNDNGTTHGIRPRWGRIYAVGPDQTEFKVGQWVMLSHGRWTRGVEIEDNDGEKIIRKVDTNDIMMVSDTKPNDDTMSAAIHADAKPTHMQHT
jgi:co-chaperonin GroES (HSP10)